MISSKNILDGELDSLRDVRYLTKETFDLCNQRTHVHAGDILLTIVGSLGRSCIYRGGYMLTFQRSVAVITPLIDSEYLKLFFDSGHFQYHITQNARGTAQKGFYLNQLESSYIAIPPLAEQKRIVQKASDYLMITSSIENSCHQFRYLSLRAKDIILNLAIHGKLVSQDPRDEPAVEMLKRINPEFRPSDNLHYGDSLPKGWTCGLFGDLNQHCNKTENPMSSSKEYELYSVPAYDSGSPEYLHGQDIGSTKQLVTLGDVLLCKINPHLNRAWVVSHYRSELACIASSEWIVFSSPAITSDYARYFFMSPQFKEMMLSNVSGVGGSLMRTRASAVQDYPIWIPPIEEQKRIINRIEELFQIIDRIGNAVND